MYDFEMQHPIQSSGLAYSNDTLDVTFDINAKAIKFTWLNKLNDGVKISWDEVSISLNGKAYRVVHKETGINNIREVQPPTTIPPKAMLEDGFVPSDNFYQVWSGNSNKKITVIGNMFPAFYYNKKDKDRAFKLKGTKLTVFFPFYVAGKYVSSYYDIYIRDIRTK